MLLFENEIQLWQARAGNPRWKDLASKNRAVSLLVSADSADECSLSPDPCQVHAA
jgi:hypothetical protein